jgi:hypothetical protein
VNNHWKIQPHDCGQRGKKVTRKITSWVWKNRTRRPRNGPSGANARDVQVKTKEAIANTLASPRARSGDRLSAPDPHFDFPASSPIFSGAPRWAPNRSLWNSCFWVHARWVCTLYFHAWGGVFGTITVCHRAGRFSRSAESFGGEDRSAPRGTPAPQIPHSR